MTRKFGAMRSASDDRFISQLHQHGEVAHPVAIDRGLKQASKYKGKIAEHLSARSKRRASQSALRSKAHVVGSAVNRLRRTATTAVEHIGNAAHKIGEHGGKIVSATKHAAPLAGVVGGTIALRHASKRSNDSKEKAKARSRHAVAGGLLTAVGAAGLVGINKRHAQKLYRGLRTAQRDIGKSFGVSAGGEAIKKAKHFVRSHRTAAKIGSAAYAAVGANSVRKAFSKTPEHYLSHDELCNKIDLILSRPELSLAIFGQNESERARAIKGTAAAYESMNMANMATHAHRGLKHGIMHPQTGKFMRVHAGTAKTLRGIGIAGAVGLGAYGAKKLLTKKKKFKSASTALSLSNEAKEFRKFANSVMCNDAESRNKKD